MRGLLLIASCVVASLVVVSHAASIKSTKGRIVALIAHPGCSGAGEPFPNPEDCGSFLQCEASGVAALQHCPAGLEFNAKLKVCDYPENAHCSSAEDSSSDSSSSEGDGDDSSSSEEDEEDKIAKLNAKGKTLSLAKKPKPLHA